MTILIYLLFMCVVNIDGAEEGEACTLNNTSGVCTEITKCQRVIQDPIYREYSSACQNRGSVKIVCCNTSSTQKDQCEPLPASLTASKTGKKAWDKCVDYQQLVFPCRDGVRESMCPHGGAVEPIVDGNTHAKRNEFPHAVLLGYTNEKKLLDWLCGGTLISDRFILTAGHCVATRLHGVVSHVAIHPTDRSDVDPDSIYKVKSVIKHPEYSPPRTYHNIALLGLDQPVPLSSTTVPACLVFDGEPSVEVKDAPPNVIATTWSTNDILGTGMTWLRKVRLTRYPSDECSRLYPETRKGGFNDTTQLCYGDQGMVRDICQDDGGSALVVKNNKLSCMYSAVGVASYGRGCFAHSPGVYTRVQNYLGWIEAVVWPSS